MVVNLCGVCGSISGSHDLGCINGEPKTKVHVGGSIQPMKCPECDTTAPMHQPTCGYTDSRKDENPYGETRSVSSTGGEKGVKPQRMSLLPFGALAKIGEVYGFGEKKYAAHNWRKGYEWDKSLDALERHIGAFKDGEDNDPESGLSHIAHAGFHVLTLLTFILNPKKYGHFDNRYKEEA